MGIFSKKKISEEELQFQEENRKALENFKVTKALGIKKIPTAWQFIYDEENRNFVVERGPEEQFRDKNPYIVSYDQVLGVTLEIQETWSEEKGENALKGYGQLRQDKFDEVWWRYDFFLTIETDHPYAKNIRYKMNEFKTITKVPNRKSIFFRRGFELGGTYSAAELPALIEKMEKLFDDEAKTIHGDKVFATITQTRPDSLMERLEDDFRDDIYLKKIDNMIKHVKRANRIAKILSCR